MNTPFQEYTQSVHYSNPFGIRASCGNCHVPPAFLPGLCGTSRRPPRSGVTMRGELDTPAKYEAHRLQLAQKIWTELKANDSAECRSCHTPAAMAFAQQPRRRPVRTNRWPRAA
jgi:nitrate/TMAO reductase-like tetraheme cytochrome c subunit